MAQLNLLEKLIALNLTKGVGPVQIKKLIEETGGLERLGGAFEKDAKILDTVAKIILDAKRHGVEMVPIFDPRYPTELKEISNPPAVLFVRGTLPPAEAPRVAVVGSRICSLYGRRMAQRIGADLARSGVVVVSGLALGIDSVAHEGALEVEGLTVAVLAGCVVNPYPAAHAALAEKIIKQKGALVSEFPIGTDPHPEYFPFRNRIISGLSRAVVVVEAQRKSGALITANLALEQGREVYAVPGNADSLKSQGTNDLIKEGARPATSAFDVLEDLGIAVAVPQNGTLGAALSNEEEAVLSFLDSEPVLVDELVEQSGLSAGKVSATLSLLEIKGFVSGLPGSYFVRKNPPND